MDDDKAKKEIWWRPAIKVFITTTAWIAVPIILALVTGQYLDKKYQTGKSFFFGLIITAFIVTILGILKILLKYLKETQK